MAVPGQLGAERQHQGGTAEEQPQFPAPGCVVALPPGPVQTDGQQQQPGPTTLQHLHPWGPPAVAIADAAGDPGQSLAAPHQQRIVAAHTPVPEMPAQPGQQSQAEADPAAPARPAVAAAHNQGDQAQPQQCRWFQQQHATAGDPCAQSSQGMLTGSDPAPPQQQAATHQRAVQHRQPAVTGHRQQGHQHHSRQQGPALPVGTVELPAHQHDQGDRQGGEQGRQQSHQGVLLSVGTDQLAHGGVKTGGFVEVRLLPFHRQQVGAGAGHRGHAPFIPVAQRQVAQTRQPEHQREQPQQQWHQPALLIQQLRQSFDTSVRVQESRPQWCGGIFGPSGPGHHRMHHRRSSTLSGGGVHAIQFFHAGSADRGERRLNGAF